MIFTCSDEIGLEIILWQYDLHNKEKTEHLLKKKKTKKKKKKKENKKTTPGCTLHHIAQINNSFAF